MTPPNVSLPIIEHGADLQRIVSSLTSGKPTSMLWQVSRADALSRLVAESPNDIMNLDEIPGGARIEVPLGKSKSASRLHVAVETYQDKVAFVRLVYGKLKKDNERQAIADAFAQMSGTVTDIWNDVQSFHPFDGLQSCRGKRLFETIGVGHCVAGKRVSFILYDPKALDSTKTTRQLIASAYREYKSVRPAVDCRDYPTAITQADAALEILSSMYFASVWKAFSLIMQGEVEAGRRLAQSVVENSVNYETQAYAQWVIARSYIARGQVQQTISALEAAVSFDRYDSEHKTNLRAVRSGKGFRGSVYRTLWWHYDNPYQVDQWIARRAGLPDVQTWRELWNEMSVERQARMIKKAQKNAERCQRRR
jgi:hypothetical protein